MSANQRFITEMAIILIGLTIWIGLLVWLWITWPTLGTEGRAIGLGIMLTAIAVVHWTGRYGIGSRRKQ